MNRYPLKNMADEVERYGRFGDTELVHLNPAEVRGLAALSPTGKLTINPITGKKEAFLPMLIPILASYGGSALAASAGASMVGAAIAGGAASGLATYATTGDAERALMSGVMGAGIGAAAGTAGEAFRGATDVTLNATTTAATDAATNAATQGINALPTAAIPPPVIPPPTVPDAAAASFVGPPATPPPGYGAMATEPTGFMPPNASMAPPVNPPAQNMFMTGAGPLDQPMSQTLQDPFMAPKGEGMISQMAKPQTLVPTAWGANAMMEDAAQEGRDEAGKEDEAKRKARLENAYTDLQGAYRRAQPNAPTGPSSYRSRMSENTPEPWRPDMASGGITRLGIGGATRSRVITRDRDGSDYYDDYSGAVGRGKNPGYGGIDPVSIQAGLRGQHHVATAPGYMAGMQPEFNYFQNDLENIQVPQMFTREQLNAPYQTRMNAPLAGGSKPYFGSVIPDKSAPKPVKTTGMAAGGQVPVQMGGEQAMIEGGGIANVPTEYTGQNQAQGGQPTQEDITLLASVLMGEKPPELADQIINAFVTQYGPEVFSQVRQQILQMIQGPNAQTEGLIQGEGGGMDDQVMGTIGSEQPVAVSPGEYIVPADVVSGLGDGSSDAGAAELDKMQQNVRMARGGGTTQPPPLNARRLMPA